MNDERKNPPEAPANLPLPVQDVPPMLYGTYDPPDHAKMAKIVASLQALIRDNVTAFPTSTFAFHDSVGPEEREQFIADVKASRPQPILVDSPRGVEIPRISEMACGTANDADWTWEKLEADWDSIKPAPDSEEWPEEHEPQPPKPAPDPEDNRTWRQRKPLC